MYVYDLADSMKDRGTNFMIKDYYTGEVINNVTVAEIVESHENDWEDWNIKVVEVEIAYSDGLIVTVE